MKSARPDQTKDGAFVFSRIVTHDTDKALENIFSFYFVEDKKLSTVQCKPNIICLRYTVCLSRLSPEIKCLYDTVKPRYRHLICDLENCAYNELCLHRI